MKISKQEVERVAKLARLEITEGEKDTLSKQLSSILTYIEELKSWDTTGVEPTATVLEQTNVLREDRAKPSLPVEQAVMNAPDSDGGYFRVPRILEER
ncbi:MAG: Asp-tRNA(Asn)/Glu-tRNA(Gln) amidotransferase subunit GatC [Nitrospirota bacterium]|nr:Asp-tRNA(Asn)/Glu-tRNA(Gln) amidotransferase subunit GatC [Nitrospirota bacterium]